MVTLQILVLPFLVRVRVSQQKKLQVVDINSLEFFLVISLLVRLRIALLVQFWIVGRGEEGGWWGRFDS